MDKYYYTDLEELEALRKSDQEKELKIIKLTKEVQLLTEENSKLSTEIKKLKGGKTNGAKKEDN